jgi:hypothetical protein
MGQEGVPHELPVTDGRVDGFEGSTPASHFAPQRYRFSRFDARSNSGRLQTDQELGGVVSSGSYVTGAWRSPRGRPDHALARHLVAD